MSLEVDEMIYQKKKGWKKGWSGETHNYNRMLLSLLCFSLKFYKSLIASYLKRFLYSLDNFLSMGTPKNGKKRMKSTKISYSGVAIPTQTDLLNFRIQYIGRFSPES